MKNLVKLIDKKETKQTSLRTYDYDSSSICSRQMPMNMKKYVSRQIHRPNSHAIYLDARKMPVLIGNENSLSFLLFI